MHEQVSNPNRNQLRSSVAVQLFRLSELRLNARRLLTQYVGEAELKETPLVHKA